LPETEWSEARAAVWKSIRALETDVWKGRDRDNPSITARLATLEDCVERLEESVKERWTEDDETMKHNRARTERKQDITLGAVLTLICAVIAQMLFNLKR
jgi:hypothetical protein